MTGFSFGFKFFLIIVFTQLSISCNSPAATPKNQKVQVFKTSKGYQLLRNGLPYYIKGVAAAPEFLREAREAGANTVRIYDTLHLDRTLDQAAELDLAVVVDLPLPQYRTTPDAYEDQEEFRQMKERIRGTVSRYRSHPALLYWNLGNELYYPYLYKRSGFFEHFNTLISMIHQLDPDHPVSTTTIGANKLRVLSIITKSPDLDFISFNAFGRLSSFSSRLKPIRPVWNGPHVISEWGVNGPWEASFTSWGAPLEETSTKKAEQIRERYQQFIVPIKEKNSFGSFLFYWGKKDETTPTWFSLFGNDGLRTQAIYEMSGIWNDQKEPFPGPELEYMLINQLGAAENIMLTSDTWAVAEVVLPEHKKEANYHYRWEIRHESWFANGFSRTVPGTMNNTNNKNLSFRVPQEEGPYRLFVYLRDGSVYFATANIPFYVLKSAHGE